MRKMIFLVLIVISIMASGCANPSMPKNTQTEGIQKSNAPNTDENINSIQLNKTTDIKAVYLVRQNGGVLSADDLKQYPEVAVVNSFNELKKHTDKKVAVWVDKNAVDIIENGWLQSEPQKKYPVALVGYNDSLYSFREKLSGFGINGPKVNWNSEILEPGFSVWMLRKETSSSKSAFLHGHKTEPTVELILKVTNALLDNKTPDV